MTSSPAPSQPMRLTPAPAGQVGLRPGVRVIRHDAERLALVLGRQVAVVPDRPDVRAALARLSRPETWTAIDAPADLVAVLGGRDWLVADATASHLRPPSRQAALADLDRHGSRGPAVGAARARHRVAVEAPVDLTDLTLGLLAGSDLAAADTDETVRLHVRRGEASRASIDDLVRTGLPHLVVTLLPDLVEIGPFVIPGATACLRCVDAHRSERDATYALRVAQLGAAPALEAGDLASAALGLAWAVHDLAQWAGDRQPRTWSATVTIDLIDPSAEPRTRRWSRHPHCGCGWHDLLR